jgi:hypothetical protein
MFKRYRCLLVAVCTVVAAAAVGTSSAVASGECGSCAPWWHMTSGSLPSSLRSGVASDGVLKLTVSATKGEMFLAEPKRLQEVLEGERSPEEAIYAIVPYNATPEQVQQAIQSRIYPDRKVLVSGGPGDEKGTKAYTITFPGQSVGLFANGSYAPIFGGEALSCEGATGSGCTHEASVTELSEGKPDGWIVVTAADVGDANIDAETSPVGIADQLPAGVSAVSVEALAGDGERAGVGNPGNDGPVECSLASLSCVFGGTFQRRNANGETETTAKILPAYDQIEVRVAVIVEPGTTAGALNEATASGGGAPSTTVTRPLRVSGEPVGFGVEEYELAPEEEHGRIDRQAGSHPFQLTTTLALNKLVEADQSGQRLPGGVLPKPVALTKDLRFQLPPGLIGNPTPFPTCTTGQFLTIPPGAQENECPVSTVVGVARYTYNEPFHVGLRTIATPLFSLEPAYGEPARFGFFTTVGPVFLDTGVRTGADYGVTVTVSNLTQIVGFLKSEVTFWGVPGDARHDAQRGYGCILAARREAGAPCRPLEAHRPPPFLSLPTSCPGTPLESNVEVDSWLEQGSFRSFGSEPMETLVGCNRLPFEPSINVTPDGTAASTPTGLTVDEHIPQESTIVANGLAESAVKGLSVTLPQGVVLNPSAADGLQSCSEAQIALQSAAASSCPDAAKVATVTIKTPLLPEPLKGAAYLASPQNFAGPLPENPFQALVAMYIYAEDPVTGVRVKAAGRVEPNPVTGQLIAHFEQDPLFAGGPEGAQFLPELAAEDIELHFFGGDRAPLGTPARCGAYTTAGTFTPWSGNPVAESSSTFDITTGPNGTPCPGAALPFTPSLTAGTTNIQAGAFSTLTTTITRPDGDQQIQSVQLHFPAGVSGVLAGVKLCGEAEANAGTCGAESQIGETIVSVGLGGDPFSVTGGKAYITGPYHGAPFGLSIVNPAVAGPFNLGKVVVRGKLELDPHTAALTFTSNSEAEGYAIPHILDGIPLQIQHVNVTISRPGFTFNPTDCNPQVITGNIASVEGATARVQEHFQVTNCAILKFAPKFSVSTNGRTSRLKGASLTAKLSYPNAPQGTQVNLTRVKVDLPKQLPSRLTTLQKACTNAQFELNPANCPKESKIGFAKVRTPLLPVPLEGPAIFVSHGGEAFPSLTMVLQGYGVTVDLVGTTFISKKGITSSTFKTVPDVPFNAFTLTLPQGKFSALAANGKLCGSKLAMPTEFLAQNGAKINKVTKVSVTGCSKTKKAKKGHKGKGKGNG